MRTDSTTHSTSTSRGSTPAISAAPPQTVTMTDQIMMQLDSQRNGSADGMLEGLSLQMLGQAGKDVVGRAPNGLCLELWVLDRLPCGSWYGRHASRVATKLARHVI